jgi:hypothetical protein
MQHILEIIFWICDIIWAIRLAIGNTPLPGWIEWICVTILGAIVVAFPLAVR